MAQTGLTMAATAAGADAATRLARSNLRLARGLWRLCVGGTEPGAWDAPPTRAGDILRGYAGEVMGDLASAARGFATALAPQAGDAGAAPRFAEVDGRLVPLPTAIRDASQGSAVFAVPLAAAAALLRKRGLPFAPAAIGDGSAALTLFFVDYRDGDLGSYFEIGAAITARPATDPLAPAGMAIFALPVSGAFTRDAGRTIWGYPKSLAPGLRVWRSGAEAGTALADGAPGTFTLALERVGHAASHDAPLPTYTVKDGRPTRTIFRRSGGGESLRLGGRVALRLGGDRRDGCACGLAAATPTSGCLCADLRALGLPKKPISVGWTERMTGAFEAPVPLPGPLPGPA
jgi:hypothetical protein